MALGKWALPQLSRLLPLEEETLKQIIAYTDGLPKEAAAEHLKELLGDSPQALEFITSFKTRRTAPLERGTSRTDDPRDGADRVPKTKNRKKAPPIHKLPELRRPEDAGNTVGGYIKGEEQEYMAPSSKGKKESPSASNLTVQRITESDNAYSSASATSSRNPSPKPPPSAAGHLISDVRAGSSHDQQAAKSKAKVHISGGKPMHGQSSTLNDLDSAIRALEIQTNPSLAPSGEDNSKRRCNCMATRHPLLAAAPNCLSCGKIICVKEGLGPCTFCNKPLVSPADLQSMIKILREERGREKMAANNATHKRADVSSSPKPFASTRANAQAPDSASASEAEESEKLAAARQHRDRLLGFQAENARRTRIHDEAADFETPTAGQNIWASPRERALELKRQQKVLREQEWNARPEYEKRRVVVSVNLVGGKVVKKMADVERPTSRDGDIDEDIDEVLPAEDAGGQHEAGLSNNPLRGMLIRPVAREKPSEVGRGKEKASTWRRVQDDQDNEQWILDGGMHGTSSGERVLGEDDMPCG